MKLGQTAQGSFGIPPQMQEALNRQQQQQSKKAQEEASERVEAEAQIEEDVETSKEEEAEVKPLNPVEMLTKIGVDFNDKDLHQLLFKGFIEKDVPVVKNVLTATFKTLTGDEYDAVDELVADDIKNVPMTGDGYQTRRAMWIISLGVTKLQGKPVCKPVMGQDGVTIDIRETAKARRKVLGALAPSVSNQLIQKHGALTVAMDLITANPESVLKNS